MNEPLAEAHLPPIRELEKRLRKSNAGATFSLVLIGSFARRTATERSDIDVLVIAPASDTSPNWSDLSNLHAHCETPTDFLRKLRDGDDFAAWCVRYGHCLCDDDDQWERLRTSSEATTWPAWQKKITHAVRRLFIGAELNRLGDYDASAEELTFAAGHVARALLLKNRQFPLSKPELVDQLHDCDYPALKKLLSILINGDVDPVILKQTVRYLKKLLYYLDAHTYELLSAKRLHIKTTKLRA